MIPSHDVSDDADVSEPEIIGETLPWLFESDDAEDERFLKRQIVLERRAEHLDAACVPDQGGPFGTNGIDAGLGYDGIQEDLFPVGVSRKHVGSDL